MYQDDNNVSINLSPVASSKSGDVTGRLAALDVFGFIPVPVFNPGKRASRRSFCASILLFLIMVIYVITTLKSFFTNNVPRTSLQQESIDDVVFTMPNVALALIPNISIGISVVDPTIYGVTISQGTLYKGLKEPKVESGLGTYNCTPDWLPGMNFTSFLCPQKLGLLKGNLFTSEQFQYIKMDFYMCKNGTDPGIVCKDNDTIYNILRAARLFLFIEQDPNFFSNPINAFKTLFYYPVFSFMQSYEIYLQNEEAITSPDYFYSFSTEKKQALFYDREKTYSGELTFGQENILITIWLRLNEEGTQTKLAPTTLVDVIGKWGALWSVLLTTLGLYFLKYNKRKFYDTNPQWENFGSSIDGVKKPKPSNLTIEL